MNYPGRIQFPGAGCLVEFLHGNAPHVAIVLEEQSGKLRLYTQQRREIKLNTNRLLPWYGPVYSENLSRAEMESRMEDHVMRRKSLAEEIITHDLWELTEGEVARASAFWFSSLVWEKPDIDHVAAMGQTLLAAKTHFRFTSPDFEIFSAEVVEQRLQEAEATQARELLAGKGNSFFQALWEVHLHKGPLPPEPGPEIAERLSSILMQRIADPETHADDGLWKLITKGLPASPHLPLYLAVSWGLVPEHYNFLLDRADYDRGEDWAKPFAETINKIIHDTVDLVPSLNAHGPIFAVDAPFITKNAPKGFSFPLEETAQFFLRAKMFSIDAATTKDRDDASYVERLPDGSFRTLVALACPAITWPFGSAFDKAVQRRSTSLYLPEGTEHMLPADTGWKLFSLKQGEQRAALLLDLYVSADGQCLAFTPFVAAAEIVANLNLDDCEEVLRAMVPEVPQEHNAEDEFLLAFGEPPPEDTKGPGQTQDAFWETYSAANQTGPLPDADGGFSGLSFPRLATVSPDNPALPYAAPLFAALCKSFTRQRRRLALGAVITERPDPDVQLKGTGSDTTVSIVTPPPTDLANMLVGEDMIITNILLAAWGQERDLPLLYRTQDVALPRELCGIWYAPQAIDRVVRSLPPASLDLTPKPHAGLGAPVYTTVTSPIRRYADLFNQGQIVHSMLEGSPSIDHEELALLAPQLQVHTESASMVQRYRPRYWKLVFFQQQGDKVWWDGVVVDENDAFVTIAMPWAQLMVRAKRRLFGERVYPGQKVEIRLGKIHPLMNEISIIEARCEEEGTN